jgi:hypothetical protein
VISEKLCFQSRPGKDSLDQEERPDVVTFQELESCTSLHGQLFLTCEISTQTVLPKTGRTHKQETTVNKYKEKV